MSSIAYGDLEVNRSPVPHEIDACDAGSAAPKPGMVSAELRAANDRLHSLRKTTTAQPTGWLKSLSRKLAQPPAIPESTNEQSFTANAYQSDMRIDLHPSLATAWLQQGVETVGRVWILARHIDTKGRGWIHIDALRASLTDKSSPLYICGWRRLRQLLQRGAGTFWDRDENGRIWLRSVAKVALNHGVEHLTGRPVRVLLSSICSDVRTLRAHLYASFHSGRNNAAPISRLSLETATGVPERTQRVYDQVAGIERQSNIAVGAVVSAENRQQHYAQRPGAFELTDKNGKQGDIGKRYLAWRLPNSYSAIHPHTNTGSVKRTNRNIRHLQRQNQTDLVNLRAQGNGQGKSHNRVFYGDSVRDIRANAGHEQYWRNASCGIWHPVIA